ncbi:MAG: V-type ATP synthase subunit F [Planctomycetota bacterium]
MPKVAVIADPELAAGFELAGVEAHPASGGDQAETLLRRMTADGNYGLVIVAQELMNALPPRLRESIEKQTVPLVVAVPMPVSFSREELGRKFVADMIRKAIGYHIQV